MRQWLLANLFIAGMGLTAAGAFFALFSLIRAAHLAPDTERALVGLSAVASLFIAGFVWRAVHRRIERGNT